MYIILVKITTVADISCPSQDMGSYKIICENTNSTSVEYLW